MRTALTIVAIMTAVFLVVGAVSAAPEMSCDFTADTNAGIEDLTVKFTASYSGITPPVTYSWDFGDGTGAEKLTGNTITHTYTNPGKYSVRLAVNDIGDPTTWWVANTKTDFITVYHELPVASFTASRTTVVGAMMAADIKFTSTSTGYIERYEWYIDGEMTGTGNEIDRSFPPVSVPETHSIVLRAIGDGGYDDSDPTIITVNPAAPQADFHALSTVGVKPFTVSFVDDSTGYGISSHDWGFGDGLHSASQDPMHTYTKAGTYNVTLMIDAGIYGEGFAEKTAYITVLNASTDVCPPIPVCPEPTCPVPVKPIDTAGVFRDGTWMLDPVTTNVIHFGAKGDIPVATDINGDGITDIGIFRPANGRWAYDTNGDGAVDISAKFGMLGDIPVTGNFNGAGNTDIGIYRPSSGAWRFDYNLDGVVDDGFTFGAGGIPVLGNWQVPT